MDGSDFGVTYPTQLHILIVEDNAAARGSLCLLLELLGYSVDGAADGFEGVAKAVAWHPDVAVVDIGLPGLDGYEVARRVRAALRRDIFLIALTAYSQPEDRQRARAAGFDLYLVKPVDPNELVSCLNLVAASIRSQARAVPIGG